MFKKRGQGQSWSLDIILALVVFVLIVGIFYALIGQNKTDKTKDLTLESNTIISNLDSETSLNDDLTVISDGKIDQDKITNLYEKDYSAVKKQMGIRGEFCVYMIDQHGNIISINTTNGEKLGFGNDDGNFTINNQPCGKII